MSKLFTREDISNTYGISVRRVNYRIKKLNIKTSVKRKNNFLYNQKQVESIISLGKEIIREVEVIKVTETYIYIPSIMNYTNFD